MGLCLPQGLIHSFSGVWTECNGEESPSPRRISTIHGYFISQQGIKASPAPDHIFQTSSNSHPDSPNQPTIQHQSIIQTDPRSKTPSITKMATPPTTTMKTYDPKDYEGNQEKF